MTSKLCKQYVRCGVSALGATPADCFACRACEGRCPFDVRKAMRTTVAEELIGC